MTQSSPLGDGFVGNTHSDIDAPQVQPIACLYELQQKTPFFPQKNLRNTLQAGSDDDDAAMAASQVIEAVSTVLQSTKAVPELFPAMESHLLPMLAQVRVFAIVG